VYRLPAGTTPGVPPIAGDAMADRRDPPELLGVDVDQFARPFALIAHDRRLGLERPQLAQPETAQYAADRRDRMPSSFIIIAASSFWLNPLSLRALAIARPKVISVGDMAQPRCALFVVRRRFADLRIGPGTG
jgi:hypothetical protein